MAEEDKHDCFQQVFSTGPRRIVVSCAAHTGGTTLMKRIARLYDQDGKETWVATGFGKEWKVKKRFRSATNVMELLRLARPKVIVVDNRLASEPLDGRFKDEWLDEKQETVWIVGVHHFSEIPKWMTDASLVVGRPWVKNPPPELLEPSHEPFKWLLVRENGQWAPHRICDPIAEYHHEEEKQAAASSWSWFW